jgi:hypothetical protein
MCSRCRLDIQDKDFEWRGRSICLGIDRYPVQPQTLLFHRKARAITPASALYCTPPAQRIKKFNRAFYGPQAVSKGMP